MPALPRGQQPEGTPTAVREGSTTSGRRTGRRVRAHEEGRPRWRRGRLSLQKVLNVPSVRPGVQVSTGTGGEHGNSAEPADAARRAASPLVPLFIGEVRPRGRVVRRGRGRRCAGLGLDQHPAPVRRSRAATVGDPHLPRVHQETGTLIPATAQRFSPTYSRLAAGARGSVRAKRAGDRQARQLQRAVSRTRLGTASHTKETNAWRFNTSSGRSAGGGPSGCSDDTS